MEQKDDVSEEIFQTIQDVNIVKEKTEKIIVILEKAKDIWKINDQINKIRESVDDDIIETGKKLRALHDQKEKIKDFLINSDFKKFY